jgi:hypothetical protein
MSYETVERDTWKLIWEMCCADPCCLWSILCERVSMYPRSTQDVLSFTKLPCVLLNVPALPFKKTFHAFYLLTFMMKIDCNPINFLRNELFFVFLVRSKIPSLSIQCYWFTGGCHEDFVLFSLVPIFFNLFATMKWLLRGRKREKKCLFIFIRKTPF